MDKNDWICLAIGAVIFAGLSIALAWGNIIFVEGVESTIIGRVQVIEYKHNKLFHYDTTRLTLQTLSGDEALYFFLGHIDLEFAGIYRITCVQKSPLGNHMMMYNDAIKIEKITLSD